MDVHCDIKNLWFQTTIKEGVCWKLREYQTFSKSAKKIQFRWQGHPTEEVQNASQFFSGDKSKLEDGGDGTRLLTPTTKTGGIWLHVRLQARTTTGHWAAETKYPWSRCATHDCGASWSVLLTQVTFETLPKAQRTLLHWILWLIQHLKFKAEASTSFKILIKLRYGFVWQRAKIPKKNDKSM